ncbi:putative odorant receptor 85d [Camponotus floridanus]|nr:putative odorant receptor 85d [Camponotus floridanus]
MASCNIWNKEMAHEFSLYRRTMWPLGSWPLDHDRNFAKYRALLVIIIQSIMVIYISIGYNKDGILSIIVDQLVLASCSMLSIIKITLIRLHRDDLMKNLCNAANNWTCIARQEHRQVMLRYTNLGRFVFFFQMGSAYVVVVSLAFGPLLSFAMSSSLQNVTRFEEQMELPHEMTCPSDVPIVCYGMYLLQTIQLMFTAMGNVGSDVFLFGICMHLCGQLEILSLELLQFHKGMKNRYSTRMKMMALTERHCLLLDLADSIVSTLDTILIAQLILHASLICLLGLQLIVSLAVHDFAVVGTSIMSFNVLMIQLFLYSYMGETLSSKTEAISQAAYLNDWYDLPRNIVRDLCFIIARANVPVHIRAGKFYNIDFNSFKNVLKASVSYFSVLQIMFTQ